MATKVVDISETTPDGTERVLRHTFYGKDEKEAAHRIQSHRKADKFLDAALSGRDYQGIKLSVHKDGGRAKKPRGGGSY